MFNQGFCIQLFLEAARAEGEEESKTKIDLQCLQRGLKVICAAGAGSYQGFDGVLWVVRERLTVLAIFQPEPRRLLLSELL